MAEKETEKINDILSTLGQDGICTGWFIVTEWMDMNNNYEIVAWGDGSNAPWKYDGMLTYAINEQLAYEHDEDEED